MKTAEEANIERVYYCGPVKTSQKLFLLTTLENLMKYWPVGSHTVMNSNTRFTGDRSLISIGYKYRYPKVLGFIATDGSRSTVPDLTCLPHYSDDCSNVSIFPFICPCFLGRYFSACY